MTLQGVWLVPLLQTIWLGSTAAAWADEIVKADETTRTEETTSAAETASAAEMALAARSIGLD